VQNHANKQMLMET